MGTLSAMEYALRVCESVAFGLHSSIGITEPCHGIGKSLTEDSLPRWFWPVAALFLGLVSFANFSDKDAVVLGAQAYIAAFHSGAVYTHVRLNHHPVSTLPATLFVLIATSVTALRVSFWIALLGTVACGAAGALLGRVLVTPSPEMRSPLLEPTTLPTLSRESEHGPQAGTEVARSQIPSANPLVVWNRAPRPLSVNCGGAVTLLPTNHRAGFAKITPTVKVLDPTSNSCVFELQGLPNIGVMPGGKRTMVIIQEVGNVVTASMKYVAADVETIRRSVVGFNAEKQRKTSPELEERLNAAMKCGDEESARAVLVEMSKSQS